MRALCISGKSGVRVKRKIKLTVQHSYTYLTYLSVLIHFLLPRNEIKNARKTVFFVAKKTHLFEIYWYVF